MHSHGSVAEVEQPDGAEHDLRVEGHVVVHEENVGGVPLAQVGEPAGEAAGTAGVRVRQQGRVRPRREHEVAPVVDDDHLDPPRARGGPPRAIEAQEVVGELRRPVEGGDDDPERDGAGRGVDGAPRAAGHGGLAVETGDAHVQRAVDELVERRDRERVGLVRARDLLGARDDPRDRVRGARAAPRRARGRRS